MNMTIEQITAAYPNVAKLESQAGRELLAEVMGQLSALAVENVGLATFIKDDCWAWDDKAEEYFDAADCMPETPATDAFLAEVRAQGVDSAIKAMGVFTSDECGDSVYIAVTELAAQLRKGETQ